MCGHVWRNSETAEGREDGRKIEREEGRETEKGGREREREGGREEK